MFRGTFWQSFALSILGAGVALFLSGCAATGGYAAYNVPATRPTNPDNVKVAVSLQNSAVYVMEGDKPLLVTATAVGRTDSPTPKGNFLVYLRDATRRNRTYGFRMKADGTVIPGRSGDGQAGKFIGYPMAYWVEFSPGYGFHEGSVWPVPRSKGCLRLHKNVAPKFFALTKIGTPVNISDTQPYDETIGKDIDRPRDYNEPDRPVSVLISDAAYDRPKGPIFTN